MLSVDEVILPSQAASARADAKRVAVFPFVEHVPHDQWPHDTSDNTLQLAQGVLGAADSLERAGALHLDLEPRNVLVSQLADGRCEVWLLAAGLRACVYSRCRRFG